MGAADARILARTLAGGIGVGEKSDLSPAPGLPDKTGEMADNLLRLRVPVIVQLARRNMHLGEIVIKDVVVDTVGGEVIQRSLKVLRRGGILVTVAGEYKPGRMRFTITDFTVPLAGLPITISPDCLNVPCDAFSTCRHGQCFTNEVSCQGGACACANVTAATNTTRITQTNLRIGSSFLNADPVPHETRV